MSDAQLVPRNLEAEMALLGLLINDPAAFGDVEGMLQATDFHEPTHQLMFAAFVNLTHGGGIVSGPAIHDRLSGSRCYTEMGGFQYVYNLAERAPPSTSGLHHAGLVAACAERRRLIAIADRLRSDAMAGVVEPDGLIAQAEGAMGRVSGDSGRADAWIDSDAMVTRMGDILAGRGAPQYTTTGYSGVDEVQGGLRLGRMNVWAGRPSMGKSAVATCMARRIARAGIPVGMFSLEMDEDEIILRMACDAAYDRDNPDSPVYFDAQRRRMRSEPAQLLARAGVDIRGLPMWFDCQSGLKPSQIATRAKRLIRRMERAGIKEPGVLIVDHLHIVAPEDEYRGNRVAEVGQASQALASLAKDTGWGLQVLAQLSRDVDKRTNTDKRPQVSDLRWAGEIEQDANTINFIYRPEKYLREPENKSDSDAMLLYEEQKDRWRNKLLVLNEKNRGGPTGTEHEMNISLAHNALWENQVSI